MPKKKKHKEAKDTGVSADIAARLKATPEQQQVVGPLVAYLVERGWALGQMIFGKSEWRIPKSPSEQTKREKGQGNVPYWL
jgi:type I restriction enzyme M protein